MDFDQLNRMLGQQGLYCKDMMGDGNCLFRALSDQIDGTPDNHQTHRQQICQYMEDNPDEFVPFLDTQFDKYLENMRELGVFGGHFEIVAFSKLHRANVRIYQLDTRPLFIEGGSGAARMTIHIAYHSYEHYSSVRNLQGPHQGLPKVRSAVVEKIVSRTGVENINLILNLLHRRDSDQVMELLARWMSEDPQGDWWLENAPHNYTGPSSVKPQPPPKKNNKKARRLEAKKQKKKKKKQHFSST